MSLRLAFGMFCFCLSIPTMSIAGSVEKGLAAYNSGDFQKALTLWLPKAQKGDAAAQNNMGVLWENGLTAQTPKNDSQASAWYKLSAQQGFPMAMTNLAKVQLRYGYRDSAISWLTLAARWNEPNAAGQLNQLGLAIPAPDLAAAQQQAQAQALNSMGYALGCAIGGGCANPSSAPSYPTPALLPVAQVPVPPAARQPHCVLSTWERDMHGNPKVDCD